MEQLRITQTEAIVYLAIINAVLGLLFGFFPLLTGIIIKNRKYGIYGFLGSIIGGAILGVILSFPIAFVFTWLILRNTSKPAENNVENEFPADAPIVNPDENF